VETKHDLYYLYWQLEDYAMSVQELKLQTRIFGVYDLVDKYV
jgi:hypothetical protein